MIVCPQCRRQFASKQALAQHRQASHVAQIPARRMARQPKTARAAGTGSIPGMVSSGSDLLASCSLSSNSGTGTVLLNLPLGPAHITPSRFRNESVLWSRWRPRSLRLSIVGSGASTTFGSVCVAWNPDEIWVPTQSASDFMRVAAMRPSVTMRLHESRVLTIPTETLTKWYQCDGLPDISAHGSVVVVVAARAGGFSGSLNLNITLDWVVQFQGIEMPGESATITDVIMPDSGWTNLFTTSDGSFNADRLTFKMHSGGDMAPFSAAREDHVYTVSGETKVYYYDESGAERYCTWFAKVQRFSVPGLLLFASRADAVAYITSGDVTKALKYVKASKLATPAILRFKGEPIHQDTVSHTRDLLTKAFLEMLPYVNETAVHAMMPVERWKIFKDLAISCSRGHCLEEYEVVSGGSSPRGEVDGPQL